MLVATPSRPNPQLKFRPGFFVGVCFKAVFYACLCGSGLFVGPCFWAVVSGDPHLLFITQCKSIHKC